MNPQPLQDVLVISLEHAVAAPYCSSRLANAGARVVKIERPEGDFARDYDREVYGESSFFVWINQGKESVALDLRQDAARERLLGLLAEADVFVQNLVPGAAERLGLGSASLRERHPRLITCDITGYGETGPMHDLKAYDLLVQAESGLVSVNGAPGPWGRIGVSICDIAAGMNAAQGILAFAICPGFTMTGMADDYLASRGGDKLLADIPLGRVAMPDEVAELAAFCALSAPPSMTGAVLDINGASYVR